MIPAQRYAADGMQWALAEKFPGWKIVLSPLGMWDAEWHSADGHTSRYVMAFTAGQLDGKLSRITAAGEL